MANRNGLKLVTDKPTKPRRTYAGEPLECAKCKSRDLIETFAPHYRDGRIVKGKSTGWACPYCQRIIWP